MLGKQAKVLSDKNICDLLAFTGRTRYPSRNRVIVLLSVKAGLRAGEIANLTWNMVTDPTGNVDAVIALPDHIAKNKSGRQIPLHSDLRAALTALQNVTGDTGPLIKSERDQAMTPASIVNWFGTAYRAIGLSGCSSHSGWEGLSGCGWSGEETEEPFELYSRNVHHVLVLVGPQTG